MPTRITAIPGGLVQDLTTILDRLPNDGVTVVASAFTMQTGGKSSNSVVACHRLA